MNCFNKLILTEALSLLFVWLAAATDKGIQKAFSK